MCDPELIGAILEKLGYLEKKKEADPKDEVHEKGSEAVNLKIEGKRKVSKKNNCQLLA